MSPRKPYRWLMAAAALLLGMQASATMVQQMNLDEMTDNSATIVRGKITEIELGTVEAGGGELPTITYVISVSDVLKGSAGEEMRVTMFGSLKPLRGAGEVKSLAAMFKGPELAAGNEYLLFLSQPSSIGLSMTVGVGQGSFKFLDDNMVLNEARNSGLFRGIDNQGLPTTGPIAYDALASRIQSLIVN